MRNVKDYMLSRPCSCRSTCKTETLSCLGSHSRAQVHNCRACGWVCYLQADQGVHSDVQRLCGKRNECETWSERVMDRAGLCVFMYGQETGWSRARVGLDQRGSRSSRPRSEHDLSRGSAGQEVGCPAPSNFRPGAVASPP